jgi:hypothetical protein
VPLLPQVPSVGPSTGYRHNAWGYIVLTILQCYRRLLVDTEGLRVDPLVFKVKAAATFTMQPRRFVRKGILEPLKFVES